MIVVVPCACSAANNIAMHYTVPTWLVSDESGINIEKFAKLGNAFMNSKIPV